MIAEDEVGREVLEDGRGIRCDVALTLGSGQILEQAWLEPLVAVEHEHGKQPVRQLGPHDLRAGEIEALRAGGPG